MDRNLLKSFIPINSLKAGNLDVLAEEARIESWPSGSRLFSQGDSDSDALYLLEGEVALAAKDVPRPRLVGAGTDSARYALAQLKPRQFTGTTTSDVTLVRVDGGLLDRLLTFDQAAGYEVAEIGCDEEVEGVLRFLRDEAFQKLLPANISALFARFKPLNVKAGQVVIRQGESGAHYFVVKTGEADVLRKSDKTHKVDIVDHILAGEGFGEEALLSGAPRNATVVMTTDGQLMRLDRLDFDELLREPLVKWISPEDLRAEAKAGAGLLDVRFEDEFLGGTIKGSINLPLHRLRGMWQQLDRERLYIVFCQTGSRSCAAAFLLTQQGIKVSVLQGGLDRLVCPP
ncbi:Acetyltransferase Pat [Gammaproteobacteria bacterium]|nr:Acetyltransferase Pat [Gammaproteobacteria bacterium]